MPGRAATPPSGGRRRTKSHLDELKTWATEQRDAGHTMEEAIGSLATNAGPPPRTRDPVRGDTVLWRGTEVTVDLVAVSGNVVILTPRDGRKVVRKDELAWPPAPKGG